MAATDKNTIGPFLKSFQNEHRADSAGAGEPDDSYIRRIFQAACAGKVCSGIGAISADKGDYFRLEGFAHNGELTVGVR